MFSRRGNVGLNTTLHAFVRVGFAASGESRVSTVKHESLENLYVA